MILSRCCFTQGCCRTGSRPGDAAHPQHGAADVVERELARVMRATPATKGAKVRMKGMKRAAMMVMPP
jgi:hypothetical protein